MLCWKKGQRRRTKSESTRVWWPRLIKVTAIWSETLSLNISSTLLNKIGCLLRRNSFGMTVRNILSLTLILRQTEEFKRKPSIQSFARALPLMSCVLIQLPHSNVNIDCGGGEDYLQCQLLTTRGRKFKFTSKTGHSVGLRNQHRQKLNIFTISFRP